MWTLTLFECNGSVEFTEFSFKFKTVELGMNFKEATGIQESKD